MYFGDTLEEKKECYELLTHGAKKLGRFFGIIGGIIGLVLGIIVMNMTEGVTGTVFGIAVMIIAPFSYYWMGYFWYFGFITVKSWFVKLGIGVSGASMAVGNSLAVSYLLGGKKTAKLTGIIWLIALMITLAIGFYVRLYNYFKLRAAVKNTTANNVQKNS